MMKPSLRRLDVGEVSLEAWVEGEGPLCILVHGWPETLWSWRHQVQPLVEAGYQVVVPNVRGYGASDAPAEVEAYRMRALVGDVLGIPLLDHLIIGTERCVSLRAQGVLRGDVSRSDAPT